MNDSHSQSALISREALYCMIASNSLVNHLNADTIYMMDGPSAQKKSTFFTISCKRLTCFGGMKSVIFCTVAA